MTAALPRLRREWRKIKGVDLEVGDYVILHEHQAPEQIAAMWPGDLQGYRSYRTDWMSCDMAGRVHLTSDYFCSRLVL